MVTFTVKQINDALDHIKSYIANHMRKETVIDLTNEGDCRQYTIAELRDAGWNNIDLTRLMWFDQRTPWFARMVFQDAKNRLDHCTYFSPLFAPSDGPNSKYGRLVAFFERLLDADNPNDMLEAVKWLW